jgi:diaminohydroxyphosphoribosylaminopyrimidine deaminase/5-amino-6-(5-phosphoribosylamino)uracil reductase
VEAGATLAGEWLRSQLADEVLLYVAPKLLGSDARALVEVPALKELKDALTFTLLEAQPVGTDLRLRLRPAAGTPR